jgi:hypothetical protein
VLPGFVGLLSEPGCFVGHGVRGALWRAA